MKNRRRLLLPVLLAGLASCASYSGYRFEPTLSESELRSPEAGPTGAGELLARVLVTPLGIAKEEGEVRLRFRVRFENLLDEPLLVVGERAMLLDASLAEFGPALFEPADPVLGPLQAATLEVAFPFPGDDTPAHRDLRALSLRLALRRGEELLSWSTPFTLVSNYDRYWDDPFYPSGRTRFSFGLGFH